MGSFLSIVCIALTDLVKGLFFRNTRNGFEEHTTNTPASLQPCSVTPEHIRKCCRYSDSSSFEYGSSAGGLIDGESPDASHRFKVDDVVLYGDRSTQSEFDTDESDGAQSQDDLLFSCVKFSIPLQTKSAKRKWSENEGTLAFQQYINKDYSKPSDSRDSTPPRTRLRRVFLEYFFGRDFDVVMDLGPNVHGQKTKPVNMKMMVNDQDDIPHDVEKKGGGYVQPNVTDSDGDAITIDEYKAMRHGEPIPYRFDLYRDPKPVFQMRVLRDQRPVTVCLFHREKDRTSTHAFDIPYPSDFSSENVERSYQSRICKSLCHEDVRKGSSDCVYANRDVDNVTSSVRANFRADVERRNDAPINKGTGDDGIDLLESLSITGSVDEAVDLVKQNPAQSLMGETSRLRNTGIGDYDATFVQIETLSCSSDTPQDDLFDCVENFQSSAIAQVVGSASVQRKISEIYTPAKHTTNITVMPNIKPATPTKIEYKGYEGRAGPVWRHKDAYENPADSASAHAADSASAHAELRFDDAPSTGMQNCENTIFNLATLLETSV